MNMWGIHADFDTHRSKRGIASTICGWCPNCPLCSSLAQNREKRMEGAAKIIKSEQYDFIMFQEVWDDEDEKRIRHILGNDFFLTEPHELNGGSCRDRRKKRSIIESNIEIGQFGPQYPRLGHHQFSPRRFPYPNGRKKRSIIESKLKTGQFGPEYPGLGQQQFSPRIFPYHNIRNNARGIPMFKCSGLLIASKYKTKVFSKFTQFDEKGSCKINKECWSRKGLGQVRFSIPLNPTRNISVDILTTHIHSDEDSMGEGRSYRIKQLNQIMPIVENSDAEVVILGGDMNDHQKSEPYEILTRKLVDVATEKIDFGNYSNNPLFHTYGHLNNTYSSNTDEEFKHTLDYVFFRKPKLGDNLNIKVIDYRIPHHMVYDEEKDKTYSLSDHEQVEATLEIKETRGFVEITKEGMQISPTFNQFSGTRGLTS